MRYVCTKCNYTTTARSSLESHLNKIKKCHPDLEEESVHREYLINDMLKICEHCNVIYRKTKENHFQECPKYLEKKEYEKKKYSIEGQLTSIEERLSNVEFVLKDLHESITEFLYLFKEMNIK